MSFLTVNTAGDFEEFIGVIKSAIRETSWQSADDVNDFRIMLEYNFNPAMTSVFERYQVEKLEVFSPLTGFNFEQFKNEKIIKDEIKQELGKRPYIFVAQIVIDIPQLDKEKEICIFARLWPKWIKEAEDYCVNMDKAGRFMAEFGDAA